MTVYPFIIHLGAFTITGYGLMMMVAFLMAGWVFASRLRETGSDPVVAWDCVVAAVLGGLLGAKLYYTVLMGDLSALLSRGGLVWYGGLAGGAAAVAGYLWWKKLSVPAAGDAMAPALAAGYALGRVGCFLVGDDYGRPTSLPWGMAFPQGSPPTTARILAQQFGVAIPADTAPDAVLAVHPTQLYEVALALAALAVLWRLRTHTRGAGWLLGLFLLFSGISRALVEILRAKDDRLLGPVSLAQLISMAVIAIGVLLMGRASRKTRTTA